MEPHINRLLGKRKNKFGADGYDWRWRDFTVGIAWKGWFAFETEEDEDNVEPLIDKRLERRRRERELKQMRAHNRNEESMAYLFRKEKVNESDLEQTNTIVEILNTPESMGISSSQTMLSSILINEHEDNAELLTDKRNKQQSCGSEPKEMRVLIKNEENKTNLLGNDKENGAALERTNTFVEILSNLKSMGIASSKALSSSILNKEEKFMVGGIENLSYVTGDKKCVLLNVITERNPIKVGNNLINLNMEQINESNPKSNSFLSLSTTPEVDAFPYDGACIQENPKKRIKNVEYNQCLREKKSSFSSSALRSDMSLELLPKSSMTISKKFDVIEIDDTDDDENLDFPRDQSKTSGIPGERTNYRKKPLLWSGSLIDILPYKLRPKEDESTTLVDNYKDDIGDLNLSPKEKDSLKNDPNSFELKKKESSNDCSRTSAKTWFGIHQPNAVLPFAVPVRKRQHRYATSVKKKKKANEFIRECGLMADDVGGINLSVEGKHPLEICLKTKVEFENDVSESSMKTRSQVHQPIPGFPSILPFAVPIRKGKERAEDFTRGISNDYKKCEGFHTYCPICKNCFVGDINDTDFNMKFNEHIDDCMNELCRSDMT